MATTTSNTSTGTTAPTPAPKTPCCCPACSGLECLERPRFFPNQFLSDTDLNGELDYVLAKNRLHNRYLHGPGVVCGMEVVCNECGDGTVTIQPGYAIDPCGNDIIVCEATSFDVVKAIDECCRSRRRKSKCNPYEPPQDDGCKGGEQHWCITIEYLEREARGVTPVRGSGTCGCGGNGTCGCGKHSKAANGSNGKACCSPSTMAQPQLSACEPTRVLERFKLCVVEDRCSQTSAQPGGALQQRLAQCVQGLGDFLALIPQQYQAAALALEKGTPTGLTPAQLYAVCCAVRQAAIQFLTSRAYTVFCAELQLIPMCPPAPQQSSTGGTGAGYEAAVAASVVQIFKLVLQSVVECFCSAVLPPCPGDPCDDRQILACVTLQNGKVTEICNFACRRFAGSFPALYYWLSIFPVFSQIADGVKRVCCTPLAAAADPLVAAQAEGPTFTSAYALSKTVTTNLDSILGGVSLDRVVSFTRPGAVAIGALAGQSSEQVRAGLEQNQIVMVERSVDSATAIPASASLLGGTIAYPGDQVVAYSLKGQVVAFAPYDAHEALKDARAEIAALRRDVDALKGNANAPR